MEWNFFVSPVQFSFLWKPQGLMSNKKGGGITCLNWKLHAVFKSTVSRTEPRYLQMTCMEDCNWPKNVQFRFQHKRIGSFLWMKEIWNTVAAFISSPLIFCCKITALRVFMVLDSFSVAKYYVWLTWSAAIGWVSRVRLIWLTSVARCMSSTTLGVLLENGSCRSLLHPQPSVWPAALRNNASIVRCTDSGTHTGPRRDSQCE